MKSIVGSDPKRGARGIKAQVLREEIRHLWSRLSVTLPDTGDKPLRIGVCSTLPGEGATTVAGNLAVFLGEQGRRTVLVETNLRNPSLADHFNVVGTPGLCEYFDNTAQLGESLRYQVAPFVDLIPSGKPLSDLFTPFGDGGIHRLFSDLQGTAEIIVVDIPPLSAAPEAGPILRGMDLAILVAEANRARKQAVQKSVQTLQDLGVPVGGVVLNRITYDLPLFLERLV